MSWYSYPETGINPYLEIGVNLSQDESRLRLKDSFVYIGDCNGLLEELEAFTDTHGHNPETTLPRNLDGQCFVCDAPVVPAIFHTTKCVFCDRNKQDLITELDEQQRLVQGQSCVHGHYLCSYCYTDKRPSQSYVTPRHYQ